MVSKEHVKDLLPAYALGSLDEQEAVRVSEHLTGCQPCQADLRAYQAVVGKLAYAVPLVEPPPGLKGAVLGRIQMAQVSAAEIEAPRSWGQALLELFQRVSPAWSLISLILIVALGASNLLLWSQVNRLRSSAQPALRYVNFSGTDAAPGATGLLIISLDGQHGTLVVDNLPELAEDRQYQLWLIDEDGRRTSGGVFSVRGGGYTSLYVQSPRPLDSYPGYGVTIEPAGGSPGPTGDRVLGGQL